METEAQQHIEAEDDACEDNLWEPLPSHKPQEQSVLGCLTPLGDNENPKDSSVN